MRCDTAKSRRRTSERHQVESLPRRPDLSPFERDDNIERRGIAPVTARPRHIIRASRQQDDAECAVRPAKNLCKQPRRKPHRRRRPAI